MWVLFGDYHHFFNLFFRLQLSSTIPAAPKIFGREAFVSQAVSLFQTVKPAYLAILGGPGMGKTSTALQIIHHEELKETFFSCDISLVGDQHTPSAPCGI